MNAEFCEQDVLVQKRRQKKVMRIESQPCGKEKKRTEGNEHQQHDFMEDVLKCATPLSEGGVKQRELMIKTEDCQSWGINKYRKEKSHVSDMGNY